MTHARPLQVGLFKPKFPTLLIWQIPNRNPPRISLSDTRAAYGKSCRGALQPLGTSRKVLAARHLPQRRCSSLLLLPLRGRRCSFPHARVCPRAEGVAVLPNRHVCAHTDSRAFKRHLQINQSGVKIFQPWQCFQAITRILCTVTNMVQICSLFCASCLPDWSVMRRHCFFSDSISFAKGLQPIYEKTK